MIQLRKRMRQLRKIMVQLRNKIRELRKIMIQSWKRMMTTK